MPRPWAGTQLTMLETILGFLPSGTPAQELDQARRTSCFMPHLNDVISAVLAVDGFDSTDVQAAKHF